MTTVDPAAIQRLEADLARSLAWEPSSDAAARLDKRVRGLRVPERPAWTRRWRRPLALLAAAALLMGAARVLTLVQQAAQGMPGHVVAYERAEVLNLSRTIDGYRVTLERAYGDPNQLVLAWSVTGPSGASPAVVGADVVDSEGRHYLEIAGTDAIGQDAAASGTIGAYDVPPGVRGTVSLTVSVTYLMPIENVPEPDLKQRLTYNFDLPFHSATMVSPGQTVTVGGHAVTLRWLRVSATAVRLRLDTDLAGIKSARYSTWRADVTLRHDSGPVEELTWSALPPGWTGQPKSEIGGLVDAIDGSVGLYQATSGTDDPSGTWTVTAGPLVGYDGKGGTTSVEGPWVFTVTVP